MSNCSNNMNGCLNGINGSGITIYKNSSNGTHSRKRSCPAPHKTSRCLGDLGETSLSDQPSRNYPDAPSSKKSKTKSKERRKRIREIEREAARRTLNGNGMNGSLPPLPVADWGDDSDDGVFCQENHAGMETRRKKKKGRKDFGLDTLFGHPYGALPYGNIHLATPPSMSAVRESNLPSQHQNSNEDGNKNSITTWHPDQVRHMGLGNLRFLNDDQILQILSFLDGPSLAGGVVLTSRFLYVAGHHEELWRDLVLRRWGEEGFEVPDPVNSDQDNGVGIRDGGNGADCHELVENGMEPNFNEFADEEEKKEETESTVGKICVPELSRKRDNGQSKTQQCNSSDNKSQSNNGCWKDIYAINFYHTTGCKTESKFQPPSPHSSPPKKHSPIPMKGIYSDTFFRSFLCRSFAIHPSWLKAPPSNQVAELDYAEFITKSQAKSHADKMKELTKVFVTDYEQKNKPVLLKGASRSWPALGGNKCNKNTDNSTESDLSHKWTKSYLLETTQNNAFRATSGAAPLPAQFHLSNYFKYCASSTEEAPLYLFDRTFATKCPRLLEDFEGGLRGTCPFWDGSGIGSKADVDSINLKNGVEGEEEDGERLVVAHDLLSVLGEGRRPDHQWLIVGPKRSGSCFHIDPNATHAWNAPIVGRKRWIFYPPGCTPPGVFPSPSGDDVCMPISIGEWFLTYWDAHLERRELDETERPLECTAYPGDVLFVPHGWWHMVLNIGEDEIENGNRDNQQAEDAGISVALTRNYVSASNLPDVLRFFDTRISQISGCRDRGEAIGPEDLGAEFRKGLKTSGWAYLLDDAEKKAKEGWNCAAWSDVAENSTSKSAIGCDGAREVQRKGAGTSILAKAKLPPISNGVSDTNNSGTGGGFSFSFL